LCVFVCVYVCVCVCMCVCNVVSTRLALVNFSCIVDDQHSRAKNP
jgi:hypothetical protein